MYFSKINLGKVFSFLTLGLFAFVAIVWADETVANTTVDVTPISNYIIEIIAGVIGAIAIWGFTLFRSWIKGKTGIDFDFKLEDRILKAISYGENIAKQKLEQSQWDSLDFRNETVAAALEYLVDHVPEIAKGKLGLTPEAVSKMIIAMIEQKKNTILATTTCPDGTCPDGNGNCGPCNTCPDGTCPDDSGNCVPCNNDCPDGNCNQ